MRPARWPELLRDDSDLTQLAQALESNIRVLNQKPNQTLTFGGQKIVSSRYAQALSTLLDALKADTSGASFQQTLKRDFDIYEVYGNAKWGEVFITSYFEPVIEGARRPGGRFTQPVYGVPKDIIEVDLASFAGMRSDLADAGARKILRGRLVPNGDGRLTRVVAYPDRAGIEANGPLKDATILAYTDPVDSFFLEIQGSGVIKFSDGHELKLGYAGQNGYPYVPIGKYLLDRIPKDQLSQGAIEAHLRSLTESERRELLNKNPSYVFFKPLKTAGITKLGTEVVPGRTIATDSSLFPKGALAFLEFPKPKFPSAQDRTPASWENTSRFVLDQDTGGAIRGPGRVDLFWGRGPEAKQSAGVMRSSGKLFYFVPKPVKPEDASAPPVAQAH